MQGGNGSNCSDAGTGTSAVPFCTISKAASVVQAGQTVMVGYGSFPETVTITAHGTAAAPIKFVGQASAQNNLATWVGSNGGTTSGSHAFVLSGAQYVSLTGFAASGTSEAFLIQNSQNVTVSQSSTVNMTGSTADVHVTGTSSNVAISKNFLQYGVQLDSGVTGTAVTSNVVFGAPVLFPSGYKPAIGATDAPGTSIVSNTVTSICATGIDLEGASTGATIENNIIDTAVTGSCGATSAGLMVAAGSTAGTTSKYNLIFTGAAGAPYSWAGTQYSDPASFAAATGQGAHDLVSDPKLVVPPNNTLFLGSACYPSEGTPEINSADASAPTEPTTDILGNARVEDPLVPDTGTGSNTHTDRGAFEFQDPIAFVPPTLTQKPGGGPLDVNIATGVTGAWSNTVTYTYSFNDGTPNVVTTSATTQHVYPVAGYEYLSISANDGYAATSQQDQNSYTNPMLGAHYTPIAPVRLLDTRTATGVTTTTPVAPNSDVTLTVGGVHGIPSGGGLSAVVFNVTVTQTTAPGFLTVYPDGQFLPQASNLNFGSAQTVPNLVTVMVTDGKIKFHNGSSGTVHVIADAEGYYADSGYAFQAVAPARVLDTRVPTGVATKAPVPANGDLKLDLSSKVPAGTKAVTLNVTATNPQGNGFITAYPDGIAVPNASNLNYGEGKTVPNLVTVPVANGKVDFHNTSGGTVDLVADLAGYYGDSTTSATAGFLPNFPDRVYDSRLYGNPPAPIPAGGTLQVPNQYFPFPYNATVQAVLINATVTNPTRNGFITLYPDGGALPNASNVNYAASQTVPNLVSVQYGAGNSGIDVHNGSTGSVDVVLDLEGYFGPPVY